MPFTLEELRKCAAELENVAPRTPIEYSGALSNLVGVPVYLKCENLQQGGSFKIRGAYTRMVNLSDEEKKAGVIAASAGNHAQGVALAARHLGIEATVYMPTSAAIPKVMATRSYGAHTILTGATIDEALEEALTDAERTGRTIIHPFDHADIVRGQGTLGLEIAEQVPEAKTVLVPTGGGGLLAGVAHAVHLALGSDIDVVGVQARGAAAYPESLLRGTPVPLSKMTTMADGIAVGRPGDVPLEIVRREVHRIDLVSEEEMSQALLLLAERAKLVVEPSGAVGVAAAIAGAGTWQEGPLVIVLTGGNIDPLVLMRVLRHGMTSAGRFLTVRVRVPDHPGNLAGLLAHLAATGANIVTVRHSRTSPTLAVNEVDIAVEMETRGADHRETVVSELAQAGYAVQPQ